MYARKCEIESIATAADRIMEHAGEEEIRWFALLRDTNDLVELCRVTQSELLHEENDGLISDNPEIAPAS